MQNFRDSFSLFMSDLYPDFPQTLTTSVSTVSFILNLLSCPFGETTCGVYIEDLILLEDDSEWDLDLRGGRAVSCIAVSAGLGAPCGNSCLSDGLFSVSRHPIVSASLSRAPVLHGLHNANISHMANLSI